MVAASLPAGAWASDPPTLATCDQRMKIIVAEPAENDTLHMPEGRVLVEFTVDVLGYVSDPRIIESADKRLNELSLQSVLRWRFSPPPRTCRHRVSITHRIDDSEDF